MTYQVRLEPSGQCFEAEPSSTLLRSAALAGIVLKCSCRNGTCRECLCHLQSGSVRYLIEWPGLSTDEKDEGCILPCVACPTSDVVLGI